MTNMGCVYRQFAASIAIISGYLLTFTTSYGGRFAVRTGSFTRCLQNTGRK